MPVRAQQQRAWPGNDGNTLNRKALSLFPPLLARASGTLLNTALTEGEKTQELFYPPSSLSLPLSLSILTSRMLKEALGRP